MNAKKVAAAAARIRRKAGGAVDVAIVLGSGLSEAVAARIDGEAIPYDRLDVPKVTIAGHPGVAYVGAWSGKRVVAFAGRVHLYQGHGARDVTSFVRIAAACGARTIVLTNAAGGLNAEYHKGDLMMISDHLNLTGATPLDGSHEANPFLNMIDAYAPHLRALAREHAPSELALREGVYAGVRGPQYETLAEATMLRRLGADAVGMSTVLETIAARSLGLDVFGISAITNVIGPSVDVSHGDVLESSRTAGAAIGRVLEGLLAAL